MFHPSSLCTSVAYDVQIKRAVEETIVYILNVQRYNKHRDKANVTVTFQVYRDLTNTETANVTVTFQVYRDLANTETKQMLQ